MGTLNAKQIITIFQALFYKQNIHFNCVCWWYCFDKDLCWRNIKLKELLAKEFEIKGLESLKYFLKMEVARSKKGIFVS